MQDTEVVDERDGKDDLKFGKFLQSAEDNAHSGRIIKCYTPQHCKMQNCMQM